MRAFLNKTIDHDMDNQIDGYQSLGCNLPSRPSAGNGIIDAYPNYTRCEPRLLHDDIDVERILKTNCTKFSSPEQYYTQALIWSLSARYERLRREFRTNRSTDDIAIRTAVAISALGKFIENLLQQQMRISKAAKYPHFVNSECTLSQVRRVLDKKCEESFQLTQDNFLILKQLQFQRKRDAALAENLIYGDTKCESLADSRAAYKAAMAKLWARLLSVDSVLCDTFNKVTAKT